MSDEVEITAEPYKQTKIMNEDIMNLRLLCAICAKEIPPDRMKRTATTCSKECHELRARVMRKQSDDRKCRFCHKPSTTTQRSRFKRFMVWEATHPTEAFPQTWKVLASMGISAEVFAAAAAEAVHQDFSLEFSPVALRWTRFPKPDKPNDNLAQCITALAAYWQDRSIKEAANIPVEIEQQEHREVKSTDF